MSFNGQTAYVTGGASGIARAVTAMLVGKGIKVYIADFNKKGAEAVAKELNDKTGSQVVWAVEVDVTNWESQRRGFEAAVKEFGYLDYVYPIAGIAEVSWLPNKPQATEFTKPDLTVMDVDGTGVLYTSALAIQQFRRQEPNKFGFRGKIAAVSSVRGFYPVPSMPIYCAAKFAVVGFVRSFGKHLPNEKVTLNAICPGIIRTNINAGGDWYKNAETKGLIVPIENLLNAFESLLGDNDVSGECFEIPPGDGHGKDGYLIKPNVPFTNDLSEIHVGFSDSQYKHQHDPVQG